MYGFINNYSYRFKENNVKLFYVLEKLDDSPESIILKSVLDGISEYYSKNLAREVQKGKCENTYKGKFNGGYVPLGYDVDSITKEYIINPYEARTVQKIFELHLNGYSLIDITIYLNENGYKTKTGGEFKKNSIFDILGSEKYSGYYVYTKGYKGKKRNDTIIIEDGLPATISKKDYKSTMEKRLQNKNGNGYKTKEIYFLSGILKCGLCNGSYYGTKRTKHKPNNILIN